MKAFLFGLLLPVPFWIYSCAHLKDEPINCDIYAKQRVLELNKQGYQLESAADQVFPEGVVSWARFLNLDTSMMVVDAMVDTQSMVDIAVIEGAKVVLICDRGGKEWTVIRLEKMVNIPQLEGRVK